MTTKEEEKVKDERERMRESMARVPLQLPTPFGGHQIV